MAAIITEKFRAHNATQFYESFSEASANTYYLFVGKATPFTSGTTGGTDAAPPTPADSVGDEFYYWDDMLAAKKIATSDIGQIVQPTICINMMSVHLVLLLLVQQVYILPHFIL